MLEGDLAQQLVLESLNFALASSGVVCPGPHVAPALGMESVFAQGRDDLFVDRRQVGQEHPRVFTESASELDERRQLVACILTQPLECRRLCHARLPSPQLIVINAKRTV